MPLTLDQLPDDPAVLKALLLAKDAELIKKSAELAATCAELIAAKNGLLVTQLTIEQLKARIAKLRREKFGASSERIERVLEQLELALEEAETAKAEAIAMLPQQPEPEPDTVNADSSLPAGSAPAEPQGTVRDRYVQVGNAVPPALAEACGRLVAGAHRAWSALRAAGLDGAALIDALRRHRLTVPATLGAAP